MRLKHFWKSVWVAVPAVMGARTGVAALAASRGMRCKLLQGCDAPSSCAAPHDILCCALRPHHLLAMHLETWKYYPGTGKVFIKVLKSVAVCSLAPPPATYAPWGLEVTKWLTMCMLKENLILQYILLPNHLTAMTHETCMYHQLDGKAQPQALEHLARCSVALPPASHDCPPSSRFSGCCKTLFRQSIRGMVDSTAFTS